MMTTVFLMCFQFNQYLVNLELLLITMWMECLPYLFHSYSSSNPGSASITPSNTILHFILFLKNCFSSACWPTNSVNLFILYFNISTSVVSFGPLCLFMFTSQTLGWIWTHHGFVKEHVLSDITGAHVEDTAYNVSHRIGDQCAFYELVWIKSPAGIWGLSERFCL